MTKKTEIENKARKNKWKQTKTIINKMRNKENVQSKANNNTTTHEQKLFK